MKNTFFNKDFNHSSGRFGKYLHDVRYAELVKESIRESDNSSNLGRVAELESYIDNIQELHDMLEDVRRDAFQKYKLDQYNSVQILKMFKRVIDFGAEFYNNKQSSSEKVFTSEVRDELSKKYENTFRKRLDDARYTTTGDNPDLDHLTGK